MGIAFTLGFGIVIIIILIVFSFLFFGGLTFLVIGLVKKRKYKKLAVKKLYPKIFMGVGIAFMLVPVGCLAYVFWPRDYKFLEEEAVVLMDALSYEDTQAMREVWAPNIVEDKDFDKHIKEAFSYVEGSIISYELAEKRSPSEGDDSRTIFYSEGYYANVKTDAGKTYDISLDLCWYDSLDKDNLGIRKMTIYSEEYWEEDGEETGEGTGMFSMGESQE